MSDSDSDNELLVEEQVDEDWEEWDGDEEEDDATKSLFCDTVLPNPEAAFEYDGTHYGFDIRQYKIERHLDDYDVIKVINFIRREVAAGHDPLPALAAPPGPDGQPAWRGDDLLTPALRDDPLLAYDYEEQQQQLAGSSATAAAGGAAASSSAPAAAGGSSSSSRDVLLQAQLAALTSENQELKLRIAALMDAALPRDVREEMAAAAAADTSAAAAAAASSRGDSHAQASSSGAAAASTSAAVASPARRRFSAAPGVSALTRAVDSMYFDSYSSFDIHHEMLSDKPRTLAYQAALTRNPALLAGATVLDVGCGTAILSMFAGAAGAAAVVGLDGSERIATAARQVVAANQLDAASGGPVSIIAGKVEEVETIGHDQVDVIVSEWMGYGLLFESMLDSVLAARQRWLRPGGAVLPDLATLHVAGASREVLGTAFWKDVCGFTMAPIADELLAAAGSDPQVVVKPVEASCLTTTSTCVHTLDLATMAPHQQDFTAAFELTAAYTAAGAADEAAGAAARSSAGGGEVAALVLWFDVEFSERFCKECPVTLSTSPGAPTTHWAQAVLPLAQPLVLAPGSSLACRLSMARSRAKHRSLDISLEYSCGSVGATRIYTMEVSSGSSSVI